MKTIVGITNELTFNQLSKLDSFVILYNKISHNLYVDLFIKKLTIKELCPKYQAKYSINKRHFDSIRKLLEGKVSSILSLNKNYIIETKDKIKTLEKDIIKQTKTFNSYKEKHFKQDNTLSLVETNLKKNLSTKINYNQQRLDRLKAKLKNLENIKNTGNVRLCFGSIKLFRQQFLINSTNNLTQFKTHNDWHKEFTYQRNKEFTLIGSKDTTAGNTNAQISHIKDNIFNLKLNLFKTDNQTNTANKYVNITLTLNHEIETLKQIIINNNGKNKELWQPLTYKLIKQPNKSHNKNKYVVSISFKKHLIKNTYTEIKKGVLGIDINQDHLAVSNLDSKGNLLNIYTYEYDLNGTKHQNNNSISLVVKNLMKLSLKLNKPIVIEQLDFSAKKKTLKAGINKSKNKQLSSFAYSKVIELIKARAEDNYIEIREVNSAYTSIIGSIKYSNRSRIDIHHGAAMCIGRKGLFNIYGKNNKGEIVVTKQYKEKRISSKNRQVKNLNLPARNNLKSVVYWKELKENMMKNKQHENKSRLNSAKYSTSLGHSDVPVMNVSVGTSS